MMIKIMFYYSEFDWINKVFNQMETDNWPAAEWPHAWHAGLIYRVHIRIFELFIKLYILKTILFYEF